MANTARLSWSILRTELANDNVPFAYLILKGWIAVAGDSEVAMRLLSTLAYSGAVIFSGLAARAVAGPAAGLVAAALMTASDRIGLEHAATVRPYALLCLWGAVASWLCVRSFARNNDRWVIVGVGITHLLGLFTHPVYVTFAAACATASAIAERRVLTPIAIATASSIVVYAVSWGPMLVSTMALQTTSWMKPPTMADVQYGFLLLWGTGPGFILTGAVLAATFSDVGRARAAWQDREFQWMAGAAAIGWIVPIGISFWKPIFEATRTPALLLPITCSLVAAWLVRCGNVKIAASFAVVCLVAAGGRMAARPTTDPYPTSTSLAAVVAQAQCGDTIVAPGLAPTPVGYYLPRLQHPVCLTVVPFPARLIDWTGQLRDPIRRERLQAEAMTIARTLGSDRRDAWLLRLDRGETIEASDMIDAALQAEMTCDPPQPLKGAFFDSLVHCRPRAVQ